MTDPSNAENNNKDDRTPDANDAADASPGVKRPDQGTAAPAGKEEGSLATGGKGAAGAGGPDGFGTGS